MVLLLGGELPAFPFYHTPIGYRQGGKLTPTARQSPAHSMSDRALFHRSREVSPNTLRRVTTLLSVYGLTFHKLTTHNMYLKERPFSRCPT